MARERLCRVCGGWHGVEAWPDNCREPDYTPPQYLSAPRINGDTMNAVQSMTNGRWYESKSALRAEYRRANVVEVGNDVPMKKPEPTRYEKQAAKEKRRAAIGRALSKTGYGAP
jgi:hypothetical protein